MNLTTSELVYINEAAKALKQKDFILIDNAMIGIDNIQNIVTYVLLDNNFFINHLNGVIINQRELSAFIKALSVESDFKFDFIDNVAKINTISGGELNIIFNRSIAELACSKFKYAISLDHVIKTTIPNTEIPDIASKIQSMNKADGSVRINYNGYIMTIFPSLFPITKADKMYVSILQPYLQLHTFIAKFMIKKKKFDIITYINYLKV